MHAIMAKKDEGARPMHNRLLKIAASAGLSMVAALPMAAHHSFSAEFDSSKPVTLEGTVVKLEWVNPHSWLEVDVPKPDGTVEHWRLEGGSPNVLLRLGWNRNSLPVGTKIKVTAFQAKDSAFRGSTREIQFPDGRKLSLGSSANNETEK